MTAPDTLDLSTLPFYQWETDTAGADSCEFVWLQAMDSLFAQRPAAEVHERPSLFRGHTLQVTNNAPLSRNDGTAAPWIFITLTLFTALLCLYYRICKIKMKELLPSAVDSRSMDRLLRNHNMTHSTQLFPMGALLTTAVALPLSTLLAPTLQWNPVLTYLLLAVGLALAYLLRNGLMRLLGTVFDGSEAVSLYITSNYLYHLILATVLIPLLYLHFYLPNGQTVLLYVIGAVAAVVFLARLIRGLKVFLTQSSASHFYLFYYLCIVETAPFLVVLKYIIS